MKKSVKIFGSWSLLAATFTGSMVSNICFYLMGRTLLSFIVAIIIACGLFSIYYKLFTKPYREELQRQIKSPPYYQEKQILRFIKQNELPPRSTSERLKRKLFWTFLMKK
jgi:hypothetical protein